MDSDGTLRIGILGAAQIAPMALVAPAREVAGVELGAVAARDPERARAFAEKHGIARVHDSYEALLGDPELDAIYNPLPNSLHCEWTIRALEAGKHVLCEKPIAANAREARRMTEAAAASGRVLMEAFHWRYHPLVGRVLELLRGGAIGALQRVEAQMCFPLLVPGNIRYRYDLAGGAMMDAGCYAVNIVRTLAAEEPEVRSARAKLASAKVDRAMEAELAFPSGATGLVRCSMASWRLFGLSAEVRGDRGWLRIFNPVAPHFYHRLRWNDGTTTHRERVAGRATYTHQLEAFAAAVTRGEEFPSDGADGEANMRVIDSIYRAAGLPLRGV